MDKIGILDPDGKNLNPLNNHPYSDSYKHLGKMWAKLPAYEKHDEILREIGKNQVLILISGTGSGKSVIIPKLLLHYFNYKKKVVMTLPKQVITKKAAEFSALCLDVNIGEEVGYKFKGDSKATDDTKLLYSTDGLIVAYLTTDPLLMDFEGIVIDEANEMGLQTILLLFLLKHVIENREDFKVIIMSATIAEGLYKDYYKNYQCGILNLSGIPNFPIESIYSKQPVKIDDYVKIGFEVIKEICEKDIITDKNNTEPHDILFFLPSKNDTIKICEMIAKNNIDCYCTEIFRGSSPEKEELAVSPTKYKEISNKKRKLVCATNIAESSLTIDGIKFVIDSGLEFSDGYNVEKNAKELTKKFIAQSQSIQRKGRTGRTAPGICYHLYTELDFKNMKKYPESKMQKSNIYAECLKILAIENVIYIDELIKQLSYLIEPPHKKYIQNALQTLYTLHLIDSTQISNTGFLINELQMDPMRTLTLIYAKLYNCFSEISIIIGLLEAAADSMDDILMKPDAKNMNALSNFALFKKKMGKNSSSDHLTLLKLYYKYIKYYQYYEDNENKLKDICKVNFLKFTTFNNAMKNTYRYNKLFKTIEPSKFDNFEVHTDIKNLPFNYKDNNKGKNYLILYCIAMGFKTNYAMFSKKTNSYYNSNISNIQIDRNSFVRFPNKKIVYNSLTILQSGTNASIVSEIPEIVEEYLTYPTLKYI